LTRAWHGELIICGLMILGAGIAGMWLGVKGLSAGVEAVEDLIQDLDQALTFSTL